MLFISRFLESAVVSVNCQAQNSQHRSCFPSMTNHQQYVNCGCMRCLNSNLEQSTIQGVEENTAPTTVCETPMISIFAWVKNPFLKYATPSATLPTSHLQKLWTAKEQSARQVFDFTRILSGIQVYYASLYVNENLYSQHHIPSSTMPNSETAAANNLR